MLRRSARWFLNDKYGKEMLRNVIPHWQQVAVGRVHTFIHPPRKTHGVKKLRSFWNCESFWATCGGFLKWWVSPTTIGFPLKMVILGCFGGTTTLRKHPCCFDVGKTAVLFFQELRARVAELEAQLVNLGVWILGETRRRKNER